MNWLQSLLALQFLWVSFGSPIGGSEGTPEETDTLKFSPLDIGSESMIHQPNTKSRQFHLTNKRIEEVSEMLETKFNKKTMPQKVKYFKIGERKPEFESETKPETKSETRPETKSEKKPEVKSEKKQGIKPEKKSEVKSEFKFYEANQQPEVLYSALPNSFFPSIVPLIPYVSRNLEPPTRMFQEATRFFLPPVTIQVIPPSRTKYVLKQNSLE